MIRTGFKTRSQISRGTKRSLVPGTSRLRAVRKTRKDSEAKIKQKLDRLCSLITRLETPWCVLCYDVRWDELEAGHYHHRALFPTRWLLTNLHTLCRQCNQAHESDPEPYRLFMLMTYGRTNYDALDKLAHSSQKLKYGELLDLLKETRQRFEELRKAA